MNSISCDYVRTILVDYIEDEVPREQRFVIKRHLQGCDECSNEYNGIRTMLGNANNSSYVEEPAPEFWNELPQRVLREVKREQAIQNNINAVMNFSVATPDSSQSHGAARSRGTAPKNRAEFFTTQAPSANSGDEISNRYSNHPVIPVFALAATVVLVISAVLFWTPQNSVRFDSANFQANITGDSELISLAHHFRTETQTTSRYGFVNQSPSHSGFAMGTMLSESLSYLISDDPARAREQMTQMSMSLKEVGSPENLQIQLGEAREFIQFAQLNNLGSAKAVQQSIASLLAFQYVYENHLGMNDERQLVLFKTAIWSYNMGLAAMAGDVNAVKQFAAQDQLKPAAVVKEMTKINAPKGVMLALEQIEVLLSNKDLNKTQLPELVGVVQQLRGLLF